jgi:hypothetical protein
VLLFELINTKARAGNNVLAYKVMYVLQLLYGSDSCVLTKNKTAQNPKICF